MHGADNILVIPQRGPTDNRTCYLLLYEAVDIFMGRCINPSMHLEICLEYRQHAAPSMLTIGIINLHIHVTACYHNKTAT